MSFKISIELICLVLVVMFPSELLARRGEGRRGGGRGHGHGRGHHHHHYSDSDSDSREQSTSTTTSASVTNMTQSLIVQTQNGFVQGQSILLSNITGKEMNAWYGIPYAKPPVGNLRFKRPEKVENWTGILNATKLSAMCHQFLSMPSSNGSSMPSFMMNAALESEDCLYLNIRAPKSRNESKTPVLVWIHGGALASGSASSMMGDPITFVNETDLIYVNINYRLGLFGFLYTNNSEAPGNQGILDQNMALEWIYNNIEAFGGDKTKITIGGGSAGSESTSMHLLSPMSHPYFSQGIMQSGSSLNKWYSRSAPTVLADDITRLNNIGCTGTDNQALVTCARALNATELVQKTLAYFRQINRNNNFFSPVPDNFFLTDTPENLAKGTGFKKSPILLGVNKDEGMFFLKSILNLPDTKPTYSYDDYSNATNIAYTGLYPATNIEFIKAYYANATSEYLYDIGDSYGDHMMKCSTLNMANLYSDNNLPVFFYLLTQRKANSRNPLYLGVPHGDESSFVNGQELYSSLSSANDKLLSSAMMRYWNRFIRYGNPNGGGQANWPTYLKTSKQNIELNAETNYPTSVNYKREQCNFWKLIQSF